MASFFSFSRTVVTLQADSLVLFSWFKLIWQWIFKITVDLDISSILNLKYLINWMIIYCDILEYHYYKCLSCFPVQKFKTLKCKKVLFYQHTSLYVKYINYLYSAKKSYLVTQVVHIFLEHINTQIFLKNRWLKI